MRVAHNISSKIFMRIINYMHTQLKILSYVVAISRRVDVFVKAFANVIEKLDDVRLVVVGPDDEYLGELRALVKALRMEDKVLITGPLYGEDKLEAYVDADVYVLPSRYETFPMGLEAYACGSLRNFTEMLYLASLHKRKLVN